MRFFQIEEHSEVLIKWTQGPDAGSIKTNFNSIIKAPWPMAVKKWNCHWFITISNIRYMTSFFATNRSLKFNYTLRVLTFSLCLRFSGLHRCFSDIEWKGEGAGVFLHLILYTVLVKQNIYSIDKFAFRFTAIFQIWSEKEGREVHFSMGKSLTHNNSIYRYVNRRSTENNYIVMSSFSFFWDCEVL
jgi:hypothetical protein